MRVIVPFGPRTVQGYVMQISEEPDSSIELSKLKEIKEIQDIKPELTTELIDLSAWFSKYFVTKRISILEIMLPSALKAKYTKVFTIQDTEQVPSHLLAKFDSQGQYAYKEAQKNNDLESLSQLLSIGVVAEQTILSQNTKRKNNVQSKLCQKWTMKRY